MRRVLSVALVSALAVAAFAPRASADACPAEVVNAINAYAAGWSSDTSPADMGSLGKIVKESFVRSPMNYTYPATTTKNTSYPVAIQKSPVRESNNGAANPVSDVPAASGRHNLLLAMQTAKDYWVNLTVTVDGAPTCSGSGNSRVATVAYVVASDGFKPIPGDPHIRPFKQDPFTLKGTSDVEVERNSDGVWLIVAERIKALPDNEFCKKNDCGQGESDGQGFPGFVTGTITVNGNPAPANKTVVCKDSRTSGAYPQDLTDSNGVYFCLPEAFAGQVVLEYQGQSAGPCPNPVPSTGTLVCNATVTGCANPSVQFTMLTPFLPVAMTRIRRRRQAKRTTANL